MQTRKRANIQTEQRVLVNARQSRTVRIYFDVGTGLRHPEPNLIDLDLALLVLARQSRTVRIYFNVVTF